MNKSSSTIRTRIKSECEINVSSYYVAIVDYASLSTIASPIFFVFPPHEVNSKSITIVHSTIVMLTLFLFEEQICFFNINYLIFLDSPIHPPILIRSPTLYPNINRSLASGAYAEYL